MTDKTIQTLPDYARAAAHHGDRYSSRYILLIYGDLQGWSDETRRARWDGAASLLAWWHEQDEVLRPPLDNLSAEEAHDYLNYLETQGLARSTIRGYRNGARALTKALRGTQTLPIKFGTAYDPFAGVQLPQAKKPPLEVSEDVLETIASPLMRARLELLLALLALGLSIPEVCTRRWFEVDLKARFVLGYKERKVHFGVPAALAFEQFLRLHKKEPPNYARVISWTPDTARQWLKRVEAANTNTLQRRKASDNQL